MNRCRDILAANKPILLCSGLATIKAAQTTRLSHSSRSSSSSLEQLLPVWPVLPGARFVLPAVLAHTEGLAKAAEELLLLDQQTQQEQQQGEGRSIPKSASKGRRCASSLGHPQQQQLLSTSVVNGFLSAAVDITQEHKKTGAESKAIAAAGKAGEVVMQLFGYPLAAVQRARIAPPAALVAVARVPDAASYSLILQLAAVAGQYQQVAQIVMGAVGKKLPLEGKQQQQNSINVLLRSSDGRNTSSSSVHGPDAQQSGDSYAAITPITTSSSSSSPGEGVVYWVGSALQQVLAAAAGVWRDAGCGDVAILMLDGLLVAGEKQLDHPGLAAEVMQAANMGDKEYEVSTADVNVWRSQRV